MGLWDRLHPEAKQGDRWTDAGPSIAEALEATQEHRQEVWGQPSRCPDCNGRGYLDRIDVIDRIMYEHCTECDRKWSVREAQTQPMA